MGELYIHDLNPYLRKYSCASFVETGTGKGTGTQHALNHPFKSLYSIEYVKELYEECKSKFFDPRLKLINADSLVGLELVLEDLSEEPCLFWLDAHFPGADFHFNSYDHLADQPKLHKPLKYEVELIASKRPNSKDVFIIDDLMIYEDGPFELLNQEFKDKYGELGTDFISNAFGETHTFTRDYRHQGFLILTPKV
tara:strand:- start:2782 stop:3369 length:588 start_codon:yes stop_codon:yes gene_type:complete